MNLSFNIASRYIFGKKKTNAINIITGISILGLTVGTAALILVLSVFNGLEMLISGMFGAFNPDLLIQPVKGKHFAYDEDMLAKIRGIDGVAEVSAVVEELALFEYKGVQAFGRLKGVDNKYPEVSRIGSHLYSGSLTFREEGVEKAVLGLGMADRLAVNIYDPFVSVTVYAPKRTRRSAMDQPFQSRNTQPSGIFMIQQDFDNEYVLSSLAFAQDLLQLHDRISAFEVRLASPTPSGTIAAVKAIVGSDFTVKDRYEQDEAFLKLQRLEKWVSYIILSLTLFLVAFNLVGAIWMILREKILDISVLKAMGYTDRDTSLIFKQMGLIIGLLGAIGGVTLALIIYNLQVKYALVRIPDGFAVQAYPVALSWIDIIVVSATVIIIAYLSALPAARFAHKTPINLREN